MFVAAVMFLQLFLCWWFGGFLFWRALSRLLRFAKLRWCTAWWCGALKGNTTTRHEPENGSVSVYPPVTTQGKKQEVGAGVRRKTRPNLQPMPNSASCLHLALQFNPRSPNLASSSTNAQTSAQWFGLTSYSRRAFMTDSASVFCFFILVCIISRFLVHRFLRKNLCFQVFQGLFYEGSYSREACEVDDLWLILSMFSRWIIFDPKVFSLCSSVQSPPTCCRPARWGVSMC